MNENARFVQTETQVVVVGAGPTGLLLAGDLAARGIECIVLERRADPPDPTTTRAFAVHARTLEQLDARGLADRLIGTGTLVDQFRLFGKPAVSFKRLPSRFPYLLVTPQYNVERLLEERAVGAGAQVLRGMEAVALSQDSDGVSVTVRPKEASDHAGDSVFRAQYVVGADGVHSVVRAALGLPYPGRCVVRSLMLADVRLAQEPSEVLTVGAVGDAFAFLAPFGGGWYRAFCWNRRHQVAPSEPVELSEVREVLVRSLGSDFGLSEARWLSRFQSDERQVPDYRVGRVFLAGDAAHCHSPAGGQGMNTGLQDAANLGWKLAAALRGRSAAGERLLDSYHAERHPVGRQVLRSSGALVRLALLRSWPARQARDLFGETVMRVPAVERRLTGTVSGVAIEYDRPHGAHPSVGRRVPDLLLAAGGSARSESEPKIGAGRLYERLRDGRFLLVGRDEQDIASAQDWADEVGCAVSAESPCALMLVRPDAYVAWASDEADSAARTGAAREALLEWCGPVPVRPA